MKIAFIGQKGIPALSGGVEKHVEKLATRLAASGQEVFVYVRSHYTDPSLTEYAGVKLIHLPTLRTKHLDAISHTFFATMHALFQNYDVVHYHSIGPSVLSILPRVFRPGMQVVATFHTRDYFHKKWGWFVRMSNMSRIPSSSISGASGPSAISSRSAAWSSTKASIISSRRSGNWSARI